MFTLANNTSIGKYLSKLISKNFKSTRQFGKKCLEINKESTSDESLQKMSNRLSQILKGNKSIQLSDLPTFSTLLSVSCEEILSAGKIKKTVITRLTNYSIAA